MAWWGASGDSEREEVEPISRVEGARRNSWRGAARGDAPLRSSEGEVPAKPLVIPAAEVAGGVEGEEFASAAARVISADDVILVAGGLVDGSEDRGALGDASRGKRLKSILAEDWDGKANLLVNELRAADGFEVSVDKLEAFLRGKDLFGWPEGTRNWIGDEMITMLRQEMPEAGYELFGAIQADATAPDAMRDYSIQHISHLVTDGFEGAEGVKVLRAAFLSNDPVLASTALICLHRLSEKIPELVPHDEVRAYAEKSADSPDTRLQATAISILNEANDE